MAQGPHARAPTLRRRRTPQHPTTRCGLCHRAPSSEVCFLSLGRPESSHFRCNCYFAPNPYKKARIR